MLFRSKLDPGRAATEPAGPLEWRSGVRHTTLVFGSEGSADDSRVKSLVPVVDAGPTTRVLTIGTDPAASQQEPGNRAADTSTLTVKDAAELGNTTAAALDTLLDTPVATLQGPYTAMTGEDVELDARGSHAFGGQVTRYEWDFDGDGDYDETTTAGSTTHTYPEPVENGFVKVRVTDGNGHQSTASARLDITRDGDTVPDEFQY